MSNFDTWVNTVDKDKSILEKAQEELVYNRYIDNHTFWKRILNWLKVAYNAGYSANKTEKIKKELV